MKIDIYTKHNLGGHRTRKILDRPLLTVDTYVEISITKLPAHKKVGSHKKPNKGTCISKCQPKFYRRLSSYSCINMIQTSRFFMLAKLDSGYRFIKSYTAHM